MVSDMTDVYLQTGGQVDFYSWKGPTNKHHVNNLFIIYLTTLSVNHKVEFNKRMIMNNELEMKRKERTRGLIWVKLVTFVRKTWRKKRAGRQLRFQATISWMWRR
jgi:hypothetical protein